MSSPSTCQAHPARPGQPQWNLELHGKGAYVIGEALVPGALYLVTESGELLAYHEARP